MKTLLLAIGFTLGGMFTSLGQAQIIDLTIDPMQSSVDLSIDGSSSSSVLSGNATIDIQSSGPPSGDAQVTDLNLVLDQSLNFSLGFGLVTASTAPGDVTLSLVTPGAPGTIAGTNFDQLENVLTFAGDLDVVDIFGLAGGSQTVDLSTLTLTPFDFNSVEVTQSGDVITVSLSFTFNENVDLVPGGIQIEIDSTVVASGVVPVSMVLLGDVDLDGDTDFQDIAPFIAVLSAVGFQDEADCDEDGDVDFFDITPFIAILSGQ